jgi:signal transduction histidine kinase
MVLDFCFPDLAALGGKFHMDSCADHGTCIEVFLPRDAHEYRKQEQPVRVTD